MSHPTWVRGLKLDPNFENILHLVVAPYVGAWIETPCLASLRLYVSSHPTWVRGLKPRASPRCGCTCRSHPTWVRGLKLLSKHVSNKVRYVAPYVGAWIETAFRGRL